MSKNELIEFLRKNLQIELDRDWDDKLVIELVLCGETISIQKMRLDYAEKHHNHDND